MKPLIIVVGQNDTMVYAAGDIDLYVIRPASSAQMFPSLLGPTHPENTFATEPYSTAEFLGHVAQTELLRHLPATHEIVQRIEERGHAPD